MARYLQFVLLFIVTGIVLISLSTIWLNPYGIYAHQHDAFPRKVAAADKGRSVKPYQVKQTKPHTVLVGNSRIEIGMPVQHRFYQQKPVYNMGLPGAGIAMQYAYALHAIDSSKSVEQVVIALDLLDFISNPDNIQKTATTSGWDWRLVPTAGSQPFSAMRKQFSERLSMLFSLSAMLDSIQTLILQHSNVNALNRYGFNDGKLYQFHVAVEGFAPLYQQKLAELDARLSQQPLIFTSDSYHLATLDVFIKQLKAKNITIYLLINPYQQPYLDKLAQYDLKEQLELWKQQLILLAANHKLVLYDFAISSPLALDVVDPASKNASDSPYFWEPAHYRPAYGRLILDTLQNGDCRQLCNKYGQYYPAQPNAN